MPAHNSVILTPGVADRVGTIFSRMPLKTNDFEASFTLGNQEQKPLEDIGSLLLGEVGGAAWCELDPVC